MKPAKMIFIIMTISFIVLPLSCYSSQGAMIQAEGMKNSGGFKRKFSLVAFPETDIAMLNMETTSWKMPAAKTHLSQVHSVEFNGDTVKIVGDVYTISNGRAYYKYNSVIELNLDTKTLKVQLWYGPWHETFDNMHINIHE